MICGFGSGIAHYLGQRAGHAEEMMTERRSTRRYDLSLPVILRVPGEKDLASRNGNTRDISARSVYFTIDRDVSDNAELDLTMTLPANLASGTSVFIRAKGNVVRTEKRLEDGALRVAVVAVIERYEIVRKAS